MFGNLFDKIKKVVEDNIDKSPEELNKILFDENGKPREEVFGSNLEELKTELSAFNVSYKSTDFSDLTKLSDDELYDCLPEILFDDEMNDVKKVAHIVYEFDMEFGNGGVSQYFVNTRGEHTNELVSALEAIGATKYAKACDEFIKKYNVKPEDFNDNIKNYFKVAESLYPYDELEKTIDEFYMSDCLQEYIIKYVRENYPKF